MSRGRLKKSNVLLNVIISFACISYFNSIRYVTLTFVQSLKYFFIPRGNKLNTVLNGGDMLLDADWIRLSDQVREEWADHLTETLALIGSTQKEGARLSGEEENPVNVEEVFKNTVKWLSATTNGIDNEDAKIVERVG